MNSPIVTPLQRSVSTYTVLQAISPGSIHFGPTYRLSSSWRKFVHTSTQQARFESVVTVIPASVSTTEGPTVLKAASVPEDNGARIASFLHFLDSLEPQAETADDIATGQ